MNIQKIIEDIEMAKVENNYPMAKEIALTGLKNHTDDYRLYEELADIYLFEGNIEKASEVLDVARELHPESGTGMYLDGYLATARGEFEKAIEILAKANQLMPNNAEILRNLGWAHVMKGDLMKGLSLLRRAYILAPDEPMVINDLSVALIAAGQENEARTVLARLGQGDLVDTVKNSEI
ncbi:tetratricopeptide repeat protein [Candidatus Gracilibacteria bacterium]|nr:tetratricopeptide repeat protein [Candidatus Gracilibacteria bacterium]